MDQPQNHQSTKGFLGGVTPKVSFILGLVVGIAVISLAGFITLLATSNNDDNSKVAGAADSVVNSNTAVANTNTAVPPTEDLPTEIKLEEITDQDHIQGNKNASVTLVEFSDFQCSYCARLHPTLKALLEKYEGEIRLVYKHFPLTSIHDQALPAAEASECAAEQGKFWEFHDALYDDQSKLTNDYYPQLASQLGLNKAQFEDCYDSGKYKQKVMDQLNEATAAGAQGTPYTVIVDSQGNTTPLSGAVPQNNFEAVIEQALAK